MKTILGTGRAKSSTPIGKSNARSQANPPKAVTRAKREIGYAVKKMFAPGSDIASADNRTAAIGALIRYSEMSEADATKTVDDWTDSYRKLKADLDAMKAEAAQKAREAADVAAGNVSCAALWSFFALLVGLLVTALGGSFGAGRAMQHAGLKAP